MAEYLEGGFSKIGTPSEFLQIEQYNNVHSMSLHVGTTNKEEGGGVSNSVYSSVTAGTKHGFQSLVQ